MRPELETIGRQIKSLRKERGWSQQHLANLAGLDRTTIGSLERCDYMELGIRKVQRVLELLGCGLTIKTRLMPTLDDLVAWNEEERLESLAKKARRKKRIEGDLD